MSDDNVLTTAQIATIFEISQRSLGKFVRCGGVKHYRQRYPRLRSIVVEHDDRRVIWTIWPNGNATVTHIDRRDLHGQYTGWVDLEKDLSKLDGRVVQE